MSDAKRGQVPPPPSKPPMQSLPPGPGNARDREGVPTSRKVLVDLFCKAGGATKGYQRAGFYVVGIDVEPQPNYCGDQFIQTDALDALAEFAEEDEISPIVAIHASPPCQHHANVTAWRGNPEDHPDLLTPTLALLEKLSVPWVVENVPEALPEWNWILCGTTFGLRVKRHRGFLRGNWSPRGYELQSPCQCYRNPRLIPFMHKDERAFTDAMGCDWMTRDEGRQAIPPAYTEYIGKQLLEALERAS